MPSFNFGDITANAENLGKDLLNALTNDLLAHVTDPAQIDLASRATATIASVPIAMIGAPEEVRAQLQEDYDTALTVLLSLASAGAEDAAGVAAQAQQKLRKFVSDFIANAIKVGVAGLIAL